MFKVYVKYSDIEYPLYEPLDDNLRIFEPVLTEEMGSAGSFSFKIYKGHPYFEKLQPCKSELRVYQDDAIIFYGRLLKPEYDFNNVVSIVCEGDLTYLLDSIQRPFAFSGTLSQYIETLLKNHNDQVSEFYRIEPGNLIAASSAGEIERELASFSDTLTVLRQLLDEYGGYFRIRHEAKKRYFDYLWDYGGINSQVIRFGENLLDLTKYVDASKIITCLIPQGGSVEYEDDLGETQEKVIDITSVNSGKDYIENSTAIEKYGKIWGYQKFEDVTDPAILLSKAKSYLEEAGTLPETIEINAVDLALINAEVVSFQLGYWTNVLSIPHGIERKFLLSKREINLLDPAQGTIVLGRTTATLTGNSNKSQTTLSNQINKNTRDMENEIQRKIENATNLITGGLGGYVILDNIDPKTG